MQTAINPALAAAMTLERAAQVGEFQPMTREGQPTVAAQLMQKAMPPAPPTIPDVVQQAGLGAQIQAMQMQDAQKELMGRLMQQQQQAPGIMGLNPQMGNFAQGGIVGYAGDEDSMVVDPQFGGTTEQALVDEQLREEERRKRALMEFERERRRNMEQVISAPESQPQPQPQPSALARTPLNIPSGRTYSAESPSAGMFNAARARMGLIPTEPVDPRQGIEAALASRRAQDEYRQRLGLKPQLEQIGAQEAEMVRLMGERERILGERMRQLEGEKGQQGLINFLLGARGFKGEGLGQVLKTGAQAARSYDEAVRGRMQGLEDLKLEVQSLTMEKRNALAKMRDDIATGDYKSAMDNKQKAQNLQGEILKTQAEIDLAQGKALSQEATARMQATPQPGEIERMMATYQRLLQQDPTGKAAQEYLETVGLLRGAGRRPSAQETRQRLLENYADNWEKMDFTEKRELQNKGIKTYEDYVKYRDRVAGVEPSQSTGSGGPAVGAVMDGYRFKGGNPADKSNWEKV